MGSRHQRFGRLAACPPEAFRYYRLLRARTVNLTTLRPWVDHAITAFGADRVLWGGDWPVVNLGVGLPDWIGLTRALLAGLTTKEQDQIFQSVAKRVYRI